MPAGRPGIFATMELSSGRYWATKQTFGICLPDFYGVFPLESGQVIGFFFCYAYGFAFLKHTERELTLTDYVDDGVLTARQREIILGAIRDRKNIIAAGGTKSGKTTFLNAILAEISRSDDRIVMLEDTREPDV